jgi:hypothetical protein
MTTAQKVSKAKAQFLAADKARDAAHKRADARWSRAFRRLLDLGFTVERMSAARIIKRA